MHGDMTIPAHFSPRTYAGDLFRRTPPRNFHTAAACVRVRIIATESDKRAFYATVTNGKDSRLCVRGLGGILSGTHKRRRII